MLVANIALETQPGRARSVADLMTQVAGVTLHSVDGDHRVLVIWNVPDGQHPQPEGLSEVFRAMSEEILEVALLVEEQPS